MEFYLPEQVQAALQGYDFGRFLRRVCGYKQWSQETLGAEHGVHQRLAHSLSLPVGPHGERAESERGAAVDGAAGTHHYLDA